MFIINKSDILQRTSVKWVKQDVKPWEIVEVNEYEFWNLMNAYWNIFWEVIKIETEKQDIKVKKVIKSNKK